MDHHRTSLAAIVAAMLLTTSVSMSGARTNQGAPGATSEKQAQDAAAFAEFKKQVDGYIALRRKVSKSVPALPAQASPDAVHAHEVALQNLIVGARSTAKEGDVFVNRVRPLLRGICLQMLSALEAAHIRPYTQGGGHEVRNGLLLRSDLHRLFDRGYLTVTPEHRLEVSPLLKEHFSNGRSYYPHHGSAIELPNRHSHHPDLECLRCRPPISSYSRVTRRSAGRTQSKSATVSPGRGLRSRREPPPSGPVR